MELVKFYTSKMCIAGQNVGERWSDIFEVCRPHIEDHILAFNDLHVLMCCLGAKKTDVVNKMVDSLMDYVR